MNFSALPINEILVQIKQALIEKNELVIEAPPGAGKTSTVPLALLDAPWRGSKKILMLEPRRVAARSAAERLASLLGEKPGHRVGYTIRLEKKTSKHTCIEVLTEGVLTRRLQSDPELSDTAAIIFDEFHERNIHSDLGLALCLQSRELFRDKDNPLKLIAMSATIDAEAIAALLHAEKITSKGKAFPVDIHYKPTAFKVSDSLEDEVLECIQLALARHTGNILVFLPGQGEIRRLATLLSNLNHKDLGVYPLHGSLSFSEQNAAIAPLPADSPYKRKIVLSTDLAETSLTIEGVNIVIDSGFTRKPQFDARTAMTRLHTLRISQASAKQRAGRAGRLAAGVCFRLWSAEQHAQLQSHSKPEILQADLTPLALQLLQWGVSEPRELSWLDAPPAAAFAQAQDLLSELGAVEKRGEHFILTEHGEEMSTLPAEPRLAHMLIQASKYGLINLASQVAALLSERRPYSQTDIEYGIDLLRGNIACGAQQKNWLKRCQQQAKIFQQLIKHQEAENKISVRDAIGFLLACAFPDRIARRRENSRNNYLLSNGRSAKLAANDALTSHEWLVTAELGGQSGQREDKIFSAAALNPALFDTKLKNLCAEAELVEWRDDRLLAEKQLCVGKIIVKKYPLKNVAVEHFQQATLALVKKHGVLILPWDKDCRQWQARVCLLRKAFPDSDPAWPDISDSELVETLDKWFLPFAGNIRSRADLKTLPLLRCLESMLTWPQLQQLKELAPERLKVPSGSSYSIDYSQTPPVLQVKLQEMFGCTSTPTVASGKIKLLVHLLSPARRPLQVTQDLEGFWKSSYQDVKKEMKGRYPKHPWPDDPLQALPTRATKKKFQP
ncbi:ATP-dependent helicase HrpB [Alteromonadaceae bacterium Bs31]|nr:ATP-dependent helicase HrpB [Alteromonadaceae bacterium Bs31]